MALTVFSITVIVLLSGTYFVVAAVHACPSGYRLFSDICYRIDGQRMTWEDARAQCKAEQTDLISIHSECVFEHLKKKADLYGQLWVGLRQYSKDGAYLWVDGNGQLRTDSPWWVPGEPSDDGGYNWEPCGQFWRRFPTTGLNDDRCWFTRRFICGKNVPLPNGSSDCPDVSTHGPFTTPTTQTAIPSTTKTTAVQSTTKTTAGYSTTNTTSIPSSSSTETSIVPPPSTTETTIVPSLSTTKTTLVPYPSTTETTRVPSPSTTLSTEIPPPSTTNTTKYPTTTKTTKYPTTTKTTKVPTTTQTTKVPTTTQTTKVPTTTKTPIITSTTNTATVSSTAASPAVPQHSEPTSPGNVFTIVGIVLAVFVLCVGGIVFVIIRTRASARARVNYNDSHGLVQPPAETAKKHVFSVHTLHDKLNSY